MEKNIINGSMSVIGESIKKQLNMSLPKNSDLARQYLNPQTLRARRRLICGNKI
jgi:hypothetical protein